MKRRMTFSEALAADRIAYLRRRSAQGHWLEPHEREDLRNYRETDPERKG